MRASAGTTSPASSEIYQDALIRLADEKVIEIVGADGKKRNPSKQLKATDQIMAPSQKSLFFFH